MSVPTVVGTCIPQRDFLEGPAAEAEYAEELAQVVTGEASDVYLDSRELFQNTYPTRGLQNLLSN